MWKAKSTWFWLDDNGVDFYFIENNITWSIATLSQFERQKKSMIQCIFTSFHHNSSQFINLQLLLIRTSQKNQWKLQFAYYRALSSVWLLYTIIQYLQGIDCFIGAVDSVDIIWLRIKEDSIPIRQSLRFAWC